MLGAPNAITRLAQIDGKSIYNADALRWVRYFQRVTYKRAPHNLYTSRANLGPIATKMGATAPFTQSPFVFSDEPPPFDRPAAGMLIVPYRANTVSYRYDRISNTYPRSVSGQDPQIDFGNKQPIAPSNVIVLYQEIGLLPVEVGQASKNRLEIQYLGSGKATVYNNGLAIDARWSKKTESAPTLLTYASGPTPGRAGADGARPDLHPGRAAGRESDLAGGRRSASVSVAVEWAPCRTDRSFAPGKPRPSARWPFSRPAWRSAAR